MNILLLIRSIGKGIGGVEIVTVNLANEFIAQGNQVSIFVFTKGDVNILDRLNKNVRVYVGHGYKDSIENSNYLREILITHNIDVVVNQWGLPYLPIRVINRAKKGLDVKVVSVYHNDPLSNGRLKDVENSLSYTSNFLKRLLLKISWTIWHTITSHSMCYVYNHSDRYIVLSPSYIEHFKRFTGINNPRRLLVQTNPVTLDTLDFTFDYTKKEKEILFVGRIDYNQKRVYRIIDTWSFLENKYPDWKLTLVGDGCERDNIERQVKKLGLKRVAFEGFQSPIEYYKRASILLLTSEYEGFPLVLAECMSFGVVPAVYGSYSAVYDIIENEKDGIILPYDKGKYNAQDMANKIDIIMNNSNIYHEMAMAAIKKSKLYSLDVIGKSWYKIFQNIVKE